MGEADCKHVSTAMQSDPTFTYIQHSRMFVQKVTPQDIRVSDWQNKALLCENHIFNDKILCGGFIHSNFPSCWKCYF